MVLFLFFLAALNNEAESLLGRLYPDHYTTLASAAAYGTSFNISDLVHLPLNTE